MCRLLGYAATHATTANDVLGPASCADWQRMGRLHCDGWGSAWVDEHGSVRRFRDPSDGTTSPDLTGALSDTPSLARITHLRLATEGMRNQISNTHPFRVGDIAFAHNGSVRPVEQLRQLVRPEDVEPIGGTTDSAIVFALILKAVADGLELFDAVTSTVDRLRGLFPTSALNLLLLSPHELIAVHANEGAPIPHEDFQASGLGHDLPRDHEDHYYQLSWKRTPHAVVFSSSGLDTDGWHRMAQHSASRVDLATLDVETVLLAGASHRAAV